MKSCKQVLCMFFCTTILLVLTGNIVKGQQGSRKNLSEKHQQYYDSLLKMDYDRIFPLAGAKVYKRGFDIPYPFGIMFNAFYGRQDLTISNIKVGVRGPDTTLGPADLSQVITFDKVQAQAYNVNLRADVWVFPFLNVFALLNYFPQSTTSVTLSKPVTLSTEAKQSGWAWGIGMMGAGGVGPVWIQADYSANWAEMELLENKVFTQIAGLRMGHVFTSKRDAEKNISIWIGMMGIFLNNETVGSVPLSSLADIPQGKIDEIKQSYGNWYDDLEPIQQQVVDKIMQKLQDRIDGLPVDDIYITYEMDKAPASRWAGLLGIQFQFSKRWQLRCESNFIGGDRLSILTSLNYRFLGFKKRNQKTSNKN
jgi:hypothetical protein